MWKHKFLLQYFLFKTFERKRKTFYFIYSYIYFLKCFISFILFFDNIYIVFFLSDCEFNSFTLDLNQFRALHFENLYWLYIFKMISKKQNYIKDISNGNLIEIQKYPIIQKLFNNFFSKQYFANVKNVIPTTYKMF